MKTIIIFVLLLSCSRAGAQQQRNLSLEKGFARCIMVNTQTPGTGKDDTCYYLNNFVKIDIDGTSNVRRIQVSDGSSGWLKREVTRILSIQKNNLAEKLSAICKKLQLKNCSYVFTFIHKSPGFCDTDKDNMMPPEDYYRFDGKNIDAKIIVMDQA